MKIFRNLSQILKNKRKSVKIYYKKPKIHKNLRQIITPFFPNHMLKKFLRWLKVRGPDGQLLIREETNINDVIAVWNKALILWTLNILVSGGLILIALSPFMNIKTYSILGVFTYILSFGILAFIITQVWSGIVQGLCRVMRSKK